MKTYSLKVGLDSVVLGNFGESVAVHVPYGDMVH